MTTQLKTRCWEVRHADCLRRAGGFRFLGIEREDAYVPIARARIKHWAKTADRRRQ